MQDEQLLKPVAAPDPRIGMVLAERYRIVRLLGEGGMGAVYEGEHILIRKRVAIKCLHPHYSQHPEAVARFHREALAATSIGHENIIEVTDMGRFPDGALFMVLEFLKGRDYGALLDAEGPQQLGPVVHIASQICDALTAAHALGIVHRDLKPENIFLIKRRDDPDFVKVLDFGISKMKAANEGPGGGMTQTGMALGTPYYMPPEQAQGLRDVDHRADIYALGVILYRALTGVHPFEHDSYPMLVLKICTEPVVPVRQLRPDLPPELDAILERMLAKEPVDRYPDCASVKTALAPFAGITTKPVLQEPSHEEAIPLVHRADAAGSGIDAAPTTEPVPSSIGLTLPRSRRPLLAAGAVAVVAVGVLGAWAMGAFGHGSTDGASTHATSPPMDTTASAMGVFGHGSGQGATLHATSPAVAIRPMAPAGAATPGPVHPPVNVKIRIVPMSDDTTLSIDGAHVFAPFDGDLPYDETPKTIRVERSGYQTVLEDLALTIPQRIVIHMHHGAGTVDHRAHRHARVASVGSAPSPGANAPAPHGSASHVAAPVVAAPAVAGPPVARPPVPHVSAPPPESHAAHAASPTPGPVVVPPRHALMHIDLP